MASPFPGMDPYLERHWLDVHAALVAETRRELNRVLPEGLVARVEERVAVESNEEVFRRIGPDVRVFSPASADRATDTGTILIDAPYKLVVEMDPIIERFIRILDDSGQLVTVIEFISPTNKRQPGLDAYRTNRASLLEAGVHLVEIDLVRAGRWPALMRPAVCPPEAVTEYRATVWTAGAHPAGYLFPMSLREKLSDVSIPLRLADQPVSLPLQPLLARVYEDGRYDRTIDYHHEPDPALDSDDARWADEFLRRAGRR